MRINIDLEFFSDARVKYLANFCNEIEFTTLGRLLCVYKIGYVRVSEILDGEEINMASGWSGKKTFADLMVRAKLATKLGEGMYRIHGLDDRIEYYRQSSRGGKRSAEVRKEKYGTSQPLLPKGVREITEGGSKGVREITEGGSTSLLKCPSNLVEKQEGDDEIRGYDDDRPHSEVVVDPSFFREVPEGGSTSPRRVSEVLPNISSPLLSSPLNKETTYNNELAAEACASGGNGNGHSPSVFENMSDESRNGLSILYPDTDFVKREVEKMKIWLEANPKRSPKSKAGWTKFIMSWLERGWERYRKTVSSNPAVKSREQFWAEVAQEERSK